MKPITPALSSWIESANLENCDFPIQNLPFASFKRKASDEAFRGGVAIGDQVVDLQALFALNIFDGDAQAALELCAQNTVKCFYGNG